LALDLNSLEELIGVPVPDEEVAKIW